MKAREGKCCRHTPLGVVYFFWRGIGVNKILGLKITWFWELVLHQVKTHRLLRIPFLIVFMGMAGESNKKFLEGCFWGKDFQADPEHMVLLLQPSESWDYRHVPPCQSEGSKCVCWATIEYPLLSSMILKNLMFLKNLTVNNFICYCLKLETIQASFH